LVPPKKEMAEVSTKLASISSDDPRGSASISAVDYEPKSDAWLATVVLPLKTKFSEQPAVLSARIDLQRIKDFVFNQPFQKIGMITVVDKNGFKLFDSVIMYLKKSDIVKQALAMSD